MKQHELRQIATIAFHWFERVASGRGKDEPHTQVWVESIGAEVDEGVRDLVVALNERGMKTIESCEGPPPWVCFEADMYLLTRWGRLFKALVGDSAEVSVRVTDSGALMGELTVRPDTNGFGSSGCS